MVINLFLFFQTQYIFLHQCIMDCLQRDMKTEDSIYENTDVIYANATALKELHSNTWLSVLQRVVLHPN